MADFTRCSVTKVDKKHGLVFGWGIVCTKNGKPYFDVQKDHIPEDAMIAETTEFMEKSRIADDMHVEGTDHGTIVHSFPLTADIAKAMGIQTETTGWMVCMRPSKEILKKYESGEYTGFSIGGRRGEDLQVEYDG